MLPIKHPCAVLLFVQILSILLYPLMEDTSAGRALFGLIGLLVLGAALYVVKRGPWLTGFAVLLALPVVVLSDLAGVRLRSQQIAYHVRARGHVLLLRSGQLDRLHAGGRVRNARRAVRRRGTFTLLAWAFAYVYVVCQALLPGSFGALAGPDNPRTWMELLFLSFTTLSSVGLGDIIPLLPMARALVMIEQFAGVMY